MTNKEYEEYLQKQFKNFAVKVDEVFARKGDVSFPDVEDFLAYVNEKVGIEDAPVGSLIPMMSKEAPPHYLVCDGTEYPIGSYPYLEQHFTEKMGSVNCFGGDGTNTFAVPKLQGEFIRGAGTNKYDGQGSGGEVGEHQDGTSFNTFFTNLQVGGTVIATNSEDGRLVHNTDFNSDYYGTDNYANFPGSRTSANGETFTSRPTSTSVLFCIKYEPTYCLRIEGIGSETTDYEELENLPSINDVELKGNKTLEDIGAQPAEFVGTMAEYEEALADGKITEGMLVNITDDGQKFLENDEIVIFDSVDTENPEEYTEVAILESGEKTKSILKKISAMFRNIRYLFGNITPVGTIDAFLGNTAPPHYLACDGNVYAISQYPKLAAHFKAQFGSEQVYGGDAGAGTFAVINLQGEFLRGLGTNSHANQGHGSSVGTHQDATFISRRIGNGCYIENTLNTDNEYNRTISSNYYWIQNNGSLNVESCFSARPTNTSILWIIRCD